MFFYRGAHHYDLAMKIATEINFLKRLEDVPGLYFTFLNSLFGKFILRYIVRYSRNFLNVALRIHNGVKKYLLPSYFITRILQLRLKLLLNSLRSLLIPSFPELVDFIAQILLIDIVRKIEPRLGTKIFENSIREVLIKRSEACVFIYRPYPVGTSLEDGIELRSMVIYFLLIIFSFNSKRNLSRNKIQQFEIFIIIGGFAFVRLYRNHPYYSIFQF